MMTLGAIGFLQPWVLAALAALPAIWWLLRLTPPTPQLVVFPPTRLLKDLKTSEETPAHSPWWLTVLRMLLAALIILLAVFQGARFNHMFGLSNYSDQWVETDGTHRREIRMRGDIRFTANDQDVESMSPGAKLVVHQSDGWRARTIEFEADERGGIERRYFSNGIARPFDAEAQRFVAKVLVERRDALPPISAHRVAGEITPH